MTTRIRGDQDIQPGTIFDAQIADGAAIAYGKIDLLASVVDADIVSLSWAKLTDVPTLGDAALLDVGTTAGTVAAGDHLHAGVYEPAFSILGPTKGGTGAGSAFTAGSIVFAGAAGVYAEDPVNFVWDNANDRAGIGTAIPAAGGLHVHRNTAFSAIAGSILPGGLVALLTNGNTSGSGTLAGVVASSAVAHLPGLYLRSIRARGTYDTPTCVQTGDLCGFWESEGYDGAARQPVANIGMFVETVALPDLKGYINFLTAATAAGGPLERMRLDSNGRLGIGTTAPEQLLHVQGRIYAKQSAGTNASGLVPGGSAILITADSSAVFTAVGASNVSAVPGLYFRGVRARGTAAAPAAVQADDLMLTLASDAWDGTGRVGDVAKIQYYVDGAVSTGVVPTRIAFYTNAGAGELERVRIDNKGNVGIGATTFGANAVRVLAIANGTAPTSSPANVGQLYVEAGALKFKGAAGTVTPLAPA